MEAAAAVNREEEARRGLRVASAQQRASSEEERLSAELGQLSAQQERLTQQMARDEARLREVEERQDATVDAAVSRERRERELAEETERQRRETSCLHRAASAKADDDHGSLSKVSLRGSGRQSLAAMTDCTGQVRELERLVALAQEAEARSETLKAQLEARVDKLTDDIDAEKAVSCH